VECQAAPLNRITPVFHLILAASLVTLAAKPNKDLNTVARAGA
jgi:hypothetical protein